MTSHAAFAEQKICVCVLFGAVWRAETEHKIDIFHLIKWRQSELRKCARESVRRWKTLKTTWIVEVFE